MLLQMAMQKTIIDSYVIRDFYFIKAQEKFRRKDRTVLLEKEIVLIMEPERAL